MSLTRRDLLRHGVTASLVATVPTLAGCRGVTRGDFTLSPDLPAGLAAPEADLLRLAALAPSGHNAQPWTVTVDAPGRWRVGSARERWLRAVDPENRELALSLGAFAENLALAAPLHGWHAEFESTARSASDETLFTVALTPAAGESTMRERIERRCAVRAGQADAPLRDEDRRWFEQQAPGRVHAFARGSAQADILRAATIEANVAQGARPDAREELADWIHWSDAEARDARDGLTPEAMGIHGVAGWYVRHFFDRETVLDPDFGAQSADVAREQAEQGGGWVVITSPGQALPDLIGAGRLCQRIWLGVRERGIGLHPMSAVLEESPWAERLAGSLGLTDGIQFVLRVGYVSDYPEPVSLRMPLHRFVRAV